MIQPRSKNVAAIRLRVSLAEIEPPIWRSVLVRANITLHELHRTIQMLFQWYDYHLYRFEIGEREFEAPDEEAEGEDSTKARLDRLGLCAGDTFEYTYDFGDDWRHLVEVEALERVSEQAWLPWVLDGARRGPPEDCGGPYRYSEVQWLPRQPFDELDEDDQEMVEWLGEEFNPEEFSLAQARHDLMLAGAWGILKRKR
ncbi:plasmid pRiA4b ORF-3 family protein [Gemmatimonadota bacterium]